MLKQAGWKLLDERHVRLNGVDYKFFDSRPLPEKERIKTVTVVRDATEHYYVCFSCDAAEAQSEIRVATGKTASRVILLRPQGA